MYEYRAKLVKVVDGDTLDLEVDLGFGVKKVDRFRLAGINTPELNRKDEREAGLAAKAFVEEWFEGEEYVMIDTFKDKKGKYGRYIAILWQPDNDGTYTSLGSQLVLNGHAEIANYD